MSDICERLRKEIPWEQEIAEQLEEAIAEIEDEAIADDIRDRLEGWLRRHEH